MAQWHRGRKVPVTMASKNKLSLTEEAKVAKMKYCMKHFFDDIH